MESINLFSELLERGGGTGRKQGRIGIEGQRRATRTQMAADVGFGRLEALEQFLFELAIGVDVDGIFIGGYGSGSVFAEIETGDRDGRFGLPMAKLEFAVFALVAFGRRWR